MAERDHKSATRPAPDKVLVDLAEYVVAAEITSTEAFETARYCLMDSLGCALLALQYDACTRLLGPVVPGAEMPAGVPVPGTPYRLDPVQAAFNLGTMIRWLDYNDTWLAAEWGHPSDNLGAILCAADYASRCRREEGKQGRKPPLQLLDVLTAAIKAHEIQGVLALENSFNRVGLDHVLLVRVASAAVATCLLGGNRDQVINAISNAWIDGAALRTYRHAPNTGRRKSWAAGDATSRAVRLALLALGGEMGYPTALSAPQWGFYDVLFNKQPFALQREYGSYVMENVLFKVSFPAEFHAQTAAEAAIKLHPQVVDRLDEIERVTIETQEAAVRIIDKTGPLHNPADRDHCLQYITAIGLIFGQLSADHYEQDTARDPRIDKLRAKMVVVENKRYTRDYLDPEKRSIANAVQVFFTDNSSTPKAEVAFPLGHRRRRSEALPQLIEKFEANLASCFSKQRCSKLRALFDDPAALEAMEVDAFMDRWAK